MQICQAFSALCDYALALDAAPMNKHVGCWVRQVDKRWRVTFNGHPEPHNNEHGSPVDPFSCYVEYNGWPAGIFDPSGGVIAAGEGANENTFIAALEAATRDVTAQVESVNGFFKAMRNGDEEAQMTLALTTTDPQKRSGLRVTSSSDENEK